MNKFFILLFIANLSFAQNRIATAKIKYDGKEGFHKLVLPTELRSFSNDDLSDFRIFDSKKNEVPYYFETKNNQSYNNLFVAYKIISKTAITNKNTVLIFENPKTTISKATLEIANSNITKSYSISGSMDNEKWFGLVNKDSLSPIYSEETSSGFYTIPIPTCFYKYLKIDFNDKKTLPINILNIGSINHKMSKTTLLTVPYKSKLVTEIKDKKKTKIQINFNNPQIINQISFTISNPKFYKRNISVYKKATRKVKHKFENYEEQIANFELNSDTNNTFNIAQIFEKELFIAIENKDNQPLTISKIELFQIPFYIITDLKNNENYTITTGNKDLDTPQYDLENFKNSITTNLPEAQITETKQIKNSCKTAANKTFWQQSWFMWLCISLAGIAITYFVISLVKDMNNKS
ncbi:hypothetical protein IA01_05300 [Flavobacterium psychrophilum]|uniref:DUF3999 family protein n=3 Tax=Flavobacterium psychrophilum TaxID=96345 RepID=A6GYN0_FLAPJ|nr:hypothetical protein [Flavobacterium psychrophilum]AIG29918.1 hypothetical protein IA03_05295 [Flavobacterium psychrophilum]AIG32195.1 hypothetical protein IA01_05300 [Flavobacterium psychrophilum]AIG34351.1 hypothetical protein IA02_04715 [Flavobacterium psychrophilum]AIG36714.1 hypothetical protein IA04_05205 [Flavobacterium psychrophilum]AIG38978.1 hypothetical protein IA05_05295 [Flavobacterium psychrophilum]